MNSTIKITNSAAGSAGSATIDIEGTIGIPEEWQFDEPSGRVATYDKFQRSLAAISRIKAGEVTVNIRSTGGDVGDALLIHDALVALKNTVITTRCRGYVASAATIIAQAASPGRREISSSSLYLVHNSVAGCEGNARDFRQNEQLLQKTDERIAGIYAARAGREPEEFLALMAENNGSGRWLGPDETLAEGLADKIIDAPAEKATTEKSPARRSLFKRSQAESPLPSNTADADALRWQHDVELDRLRHRISTLEAAGAQLAAKPTTIKTTEDPSPETEGRRSATNYYSYRKDAEGFLK